MQKNARRNNKDHVAPTFTGDGGRQLLIKGRMYEGEELKEYCDKNGLCPLCGQTRVKEKKAGFFSINWFNIEIKTNKRGEIEVYKGYHISPTCYSMAQAKEALGETDDDDDVKRHKSGRKKKKSGKRNELTNSDRSREEQQQTSRLPDTEPDPMPHTGRPILTADIKVASDPPGDDVTHTSGGSSSQEQLVVP